MPITVNWANDQHNIMLTSFEGKWELDDFYNMVADGAKLLKDIEHPFVTIVDYSTSVTPPRKTLSVGRHVERVHNPHRLKVIWVKPGYLIEQLYNVLGKIYPGGFGDAVTVDSLDEAFALAQELLQEANNGA